jgi:hypothetical protein
MNKYYNHLDKGVILVALPPKSSIDDQVEATPT